MMVVAQPSKIVGIVVCRIVIEMSDLLATVCPHRQQPG